MSAQTDIPADRDFNFLDYVADIVIRRFSIVADDFTTEFQGRVVPANEGWNGRVEQLVLEEAKKMDGSTLASLIFAEPNADLFGVHCDTWLGAQEPGPLLVQKVAATVIVCRIKAKLGVASGVREYSKNVIIAPEPERVVLEPGLGPHQHD